VVAVVVVGGATVVATDVEVGGELDVDGLDVDGLDVDGLDVDGLDVPLPWSRTTSCGPFPDSRLESATACELGSVIARSTGPFPETSEVTSRLYEPPV
jgi:hypothetical protein